MEMKETALDDCAGRTYWVPTGDPLRSGDMHAYEKDGAFGYFLREIEPELIGTPAGEECFMRVDMPDDYVIAEWDDVVGDDFKVWQTWPTCAGYPYGWTKKDEKYFPDQETLAKFGKTVKEIGPMARWFICKPEVKNNEVEIE